jgi:hypothetical protein
MAAKATAIEVPEQGSIEWYLKYSGGFVHSLIYTIQKADTVNRGRLRLAFPQVVAGIEMDSSYKAPPGFAPEYNAPAPEAAS